MVQQPEARSLESSEYNRPTFFDPRDTFAPRVRTSDLIKAEFGAVYHDSPIVTLFRRMEFDDIGETPSPLLDPEETKRRFGVDTGGEYWTEAQAKFISDDRQRQAERASMISRRSGLMQGITGFVSGMAGFTADPLNFALTAVPYIGEMRYARLVQSLAGEERAAMISRGIFKEGLARADQAALESAAAKVGASALPRAEVSYRAIAESLAGPGTKYAARFAGGTMQAGAGLTLLEPFNYAMSKADGRDYDSGAALENIVIGSFLGGFLHSTIGAAAEALESKQARMAKFAIAARALQDDRIPDFEYINRLDPVRIASEVRNDPELVALRGEFPTTGESAVKRPTEPQVKEIEAALEVAHETGDWSGVDAALQKLPTVENRGTYTYSDVMRMSALSEGSPHFNKRLVRGEPLWKWMQKIKDAPPLTKAELAVKPEGFLSEKEVERTPTYRRLLREKMIERENQILNEPRPERGVLDAVRETMNLEKPQTVRPGETAKPEEIKRHIENADEQRAQIQEKIGEKEAMALDEEKQIVQDYEPPKKVTAEGKTVMEGGERFKAILDAAGCVMEGLA